MRYIHQRSGWPVLQWQRDALLPQLEAVRLTQGRLLGQMESLGFEEQQKAILQNLTEDVVKSSQIEGERLNAEAVRSSVARRLGMDTGGTHPEERSVDGVVEMMLDATSNYAQPLTEARLFGWHAALFPTGYSHLRKITVAAWRTDEHGPMQVVSNRRGREHVRFEAPAAARLPTEMRAFLQWFEERSEPDGLIKAGLAHLWFVTIHPFDDGNGRIARAIADMALARSEKSAQRFYSMSAQINREKDGYYQELERAQRGGADVTRWLAWFLSCMDSALREARSTVEKTLERASSWRSMECVAMNERQRKVLRRLMEGFDGKLTTSKWAALAKCSQDTAGRDIQDLVDQGILRASEAGGRSRHYTLALPLDK